MRVVVSGEDLIIEPDTVFFAVDKAFLNFIEWVNFFSRAEMERYGRLGKGSALGGPSATPPLTDYFANIGTISSGHTYDLLGCGGILAIE